MDWIQIAFDFRYVIAAAIAFIVWALFNVSLIKKRIHAAILKGEKWAKYQAENGVLTNGKQVEDWIIENLYPLIVGRWQIILKESTARMIIRYLYKKLIDAMDDGKLNGSIEEG